MHTHIEDIFSPKHPPTPECHAATLAETPAGLVAAWFGGKREGDRSVGIWLAHRSTAGWSAPVEVASGIVPGELRVPCWNPVLFQAHSGPLLLFYKQGMQIASWRSMLISSHDGGHTWTAPRQLDARTHGPVKNKPIQLPDDTILCGTSDESDGWQVFFSRTPDHGQTWETSGPYNAQGSIDAIQPTFLTHPDGRIQALCRTRQQRVGELWSFDQGYTWTDVQLTNLVGNNSGLDAVTLRNGRHVLVHNPVAADWDGRNLLVVAISADGRNWQQVYTLESADEGEFSYPAVIQTADGMLHIAYTYQRRTIRHVTLDPGLLGLPQVRNSVL